MGLGMSVKGDGSGFRVQDSELRTRVLKPRTPPP
jgi:hypothetical protein